MNQLAKVARGAMVVLGLSSVFLTGCGGPKEVGTGQAVPRKVAGRVEVVGVAAVPVAVKASGTVEARTRSVISAQVMGVVARVNAEVGQSVRPGSRWW